MNTLNALFTLNRYTCVKEVFGSKFGIDWFLPVRMSDQVHLDFATEVQEVGSLLV